MLFSILFSCCSPNIQFFGFYADINEEQPSNEEYFVNMPSLPENAPVNTIDITRSNCLNKLIDFYIDDDILTKNLHVRFIGEVGIDGGGLTKELFNVFFFFEQSEGIFFQGEDCLVPYLPLNKKTEQKKFVCIGRILHHMLILTGTFPAKLSRITLMLIANPDDKIDSSILFNELTSYVNPYLRCILKKGQTDFMSLKAKEKDIIQDFFQSNKFFEAPHHDNFMNQLEIIATDILIDTPRRLILKMRQGVSPEHHSNFWNNCDFNVLHEMQTPTRTKVVNCLITNPNLTNEENEVLHYLIMYINCLDKNNLMKFVFLITGSFLMPCGINIVFNELIGLGQRPLFSTCTNTLTLPKTYANYIELKHDLNICINSDEAKEFTSY